MIGRTCLAVGAVYCAVFLVPPLISPVFVDGLVTMLHARKPDDLEGCALHLYRAGKSMDGRVFVNGGNLEYDPFRAGYREQAGTRAPGAPAGERFWAASVAGSGTQSLTWEVEHGNWSVVVVLPSLQVDFDTLRGHGFSDSDIWDIGAVAAFFNLSNRMANLVDMKPNAEFYTMGRG